MEPSSSAANLAGVLTDRIVNAMGNLPSSPFSDETQGLIRKYAPPGPQADRQVRELTLVAGYALSMIPAVVIWIIAAWGVSAAAGDQAFEVVVRLGWGLVVGLLVGIGLHVVRYYDALIRVARDRDSRTNQRWPLVSSDLDFLVQIAIGLVAAVLGAPR
jgi:hypothetical protein